MESLKACGAKCTGCQASIFHKQLEENLYVCPECGYHERVSAKQRIEQVLDPGTFEEWDADLAPADPLGFADKKTYRSRLQAEQARTGLTDAAITGAGMIRARRVAFGVTDSQFIMGSMGSVVGERLTRLVERALEQDLPLIIVSGSGGGARMHEGILSLMQMAKVSAALARYHDSGGLFISVLTNPTMGGVAASFAVLRRHRVRGTTSTDRIRWTSNHSSHHRNQATRWLSNERISAGARFHRPDRHTSRLEARNRSDHRLLRKIATSAQATSTAEPDLFLSNRSEKNLRSKRERV